MKKSKPIFTRQDWIHIQIALLCVVLAISAIVNVVNASDIDRN